MPTDESPRTEPIPLTPGSGEAVVPSGARERDATSTPASYVASSSDTLLSAPVTATREDLALDGRVSDCERQIAELTSRVEALERRPVEGAGGEARFRWFWLLFLAVVAVAWQIVSHFR